MHLLMGIFAVIGGVAIAVAGLPVYFIILPVSGFVVGFFVGAAAATSLLGAGFLASALSILVGLAIGVLFAIASYFFWYASVILAVAMVGFVLGASFFGTIGVGPDWLLFVLALVIAALFFIVALVSNFPVFFVIGGTALVGSAVAIGGLLVLFGQIDPSAIGTGDVWRAISSNLILWLLWAVGAGVGIAAQLSAMSRAALPDERWVPVTTRKAPVADQK